MRRSSCAVAFFLCMFSAPAFAEGPAPSYVELIDASTITVDWSKGNTQGVTLHGNRTLVFENGVKGERYLLVIKQDAHGSRTVTWPGSMQWPGPTAHPLPPTLTATANKKDFLGLFYDGEKYDAVSLSQNF